MNRKLYKAYNVLRRCPNRADSHDMTYKIILIKRYHYLKHTRSIQELFI